MISHASEHLALEMKNDGYWLMMMLNLVDRKSVLVTWHGNKVLAKVSGLQ